MKTLKQYLWISLIVVVAAPAGVQASLLPGSSTNFGVFAADTVVYSNVLENTGNGTYGVPTTVGDKLDFNPVGLTSESQGPVAGSHINDAFLAFHVLANEGKFIEGLDFAESGDFSLLGASFSTYAAIGATFNVEIYEVDGQPAVLDNVSISINNWSPAGSPGSPDGVFWFAPLSGPTLGTDWDGSIYIDFDQILADQGYSFTDGVTAAYVTLDNVLGTGNAAGESATITKKDFEGFSVTADVIPEPASLVLIMGTTSLLGVIRRRFIG